MSDQRSDKKAKPGNICVRVCVFSRPKLEPEILKCQILSVVCYRVLHKIVYLPNSNKQQHNYSSSRGIERRRHRHRVSRLEYRIPPASLSTIRLYTHRDTVGLRALDLDTIIHGVAEAGSVRASQWLRREHTAYMATPLLALDAWLGQNLKKRTRNVFS